jgi:hypothetical protein
MLIHKGFSDDSVGTTDLSYTVILGWNSVDGKLPEPQEISFLTWRGWVWRRSVLCAELCLNGLEGRLVSACINIADAWYNEEGMQSPGYVHCP